MLAAMKEKDKSAVAYCNMRRAIYGEAMQKKNPEESGIVRVRPGFRHVRVCVACDDRIADDGSCKCSAPSPFVRGTTVTICADAAGEVPLRLSTIARVGNGAFRLANSRTWYSFNGDPKYDAEGTWCRPVRDGDAAIIEARTRATTRAARLAEVERWLAQSERDLDGKRNLVGMYTRDQGRLEFHAREIDPVEEGEKARLVAERAAREMTYAYLYEAIAIRELARKAKADAVAAERQIERHKESIAKIRAEGEA